MSSDPLHALSLGATLYTPATHPKLHEIMSGDALREARSVVICTEDAIAESALPGALDSIADALRSSSQIRSQCFVRPRSPHALSSLLTRLRADEHRSQDPLSRLAGVVLPKVDERELERYAEALADAPQLSIMPTIETEVAFSRGRLEALRDQLDALANPVLCVRIGGNDLFQLIGIKRPPGFTIYDTPLRATLNDLIVTFRPSGYALSAPVCDYLDDPETLRREVEMDLAYGLLTKTAIHPQQASLIERLYRVSHADLELARAILDDESEVVFKMAGQMCEQRTHHAWATALLRRAELFGLSQASQVSQVSHVSQVQVSQDSRASQAPQPR